ncbi:MAG TPA: alpha-D-ribose 1-methylphosphonate 5-triphosphate diphosphatase [Devosiaceae bacterium]
MTRDMKISNARIVLADRVIDGGLAVRDGIVDSVGAGMNGPGVEDFEGDYLVPGLVELHTDHLESHYHPRPGVFWNPIAALQAHDAQVAASGITTVFDAVRIGSEADAAQNLGDHVGILVEAIDNAQGSGRLRADHFVHLRCELSAPDAVEQFEDYAHMPIVRLASLMDHTPGQRQFVTMDLYYAYYQGKSGRSDEEMRRFIAERLEDQRRYAEPNRRAIVARSREIGLAIASHDDATIDHVDQAREEGVRIAEFPTTIEAARAARKAGLSILMGAPNVVRNRSHSGNISANELARAGLLDILSSDYVPFSLMQAAFDLPRHVKGLDLPTAVANVSRNPARAAGLDDRGEIAPGQRADFARVAMLDDVPVVRAVWRQGRRVA